MSPWISPRFLQRQSDQRLLIAAGKGNEGAFEALVRRHRPSLLAHARRFLAQGRAEDAVQQALLQAWRALERGATVEDAGAWLHRILHNAAVDILRRSDLTASELTDSSGGRVGPHEELELLMRTRETLAGVAALPRAQREALLRTAIGGETHARVAGSLGVTPDAVRGLVYRARAGLRSSLGALLAAQLVSLPAIAARRLDALSQRFSGLGPGRGYEALAGCGAAAIAAGTLAAGVSLAPPAPRPAPPHLAAPADRSVATSHGGPVTLVAAAAEPIRGNQRLGTASALRPPRSGRVSSRERPRRPHDGGRHHSLAGDGDGGRPRGPLGGDGGPRSGGADGSAPSSPTDGGAPVRTGSPSASADGSGSSPTTTTETGGGGPDGGTGTSSPDGSTDGSAGSGGGDLGATSGADS